MIELPVVNPTNIRSKLRRLLIWLEKKPREYTIP